MKKASDKKTFIEYSEAERKKIFKLWRIVSTCGTSPEKLAEAYGIDQGVLNEIIADGILKAKRQNNQSHYDECVKILEEKYLPAFRDQIGVKDSPFVKILERQRKLNEGALMILESIGDYNISFSNGNRISWTNNHDNAPNDYADFLALDSSIIGREFDANMKFIGIDGVGFLFGDNVDNLLFVPCYAHYSRYDKINIYYDGEKVLEVVPRDETQRDSDDYD